MITRKILILGVLIIAALCGFFFILHYVDKHFSFAYVGNDFFDYFIGTRLFWNNKYPYGITREFEYLASIFRLRFLWATGYSYPPFLAMIFFPLNYIQPHIASKIWLIINMITYGIFIFSLAKKVRFVKHSIVITLYLLTFLPALFSIASGQINIFILLLFYIFFTSTNAAYKAISLTLLSVLKVYPILLIIKYLIQKKFGFVIKTCILILVLLSLPGILKGFYIVTDYFTKILPSLNNTYHPYFINQSINGVLSRIFIDTSKQHPIVSPILITSMNLGIGFLILGFLFAITRKYNSKENLLFLIWLGFVTLLAGKNSFWNFTPCLIIGLYLLEKWSILQTEEKIVFSISILISNALWLGVYFWEQLLTPGTNIISRSTYVIVSSLGFIYLMMQLIILTRLLNRKNS